MKIFVAGSGGYMGGHYARTMLAKGHEVICASSSDGSGIDPERGIFPDAFSVPDGTSVVVYFAQSPFGRQLPDRAVHLLSVNSIAPLQLALKARKASVQRFIYISTGTVYGPSFASLGENAAVRRDNWYALSKLHAEESLDLLRNDLEIVIVRPFGVYGPQQTGRMIPNLIDSIKTGRAVTVQPSADRGDDGGLRISLCFINDATSILEQLSSAGGPAIVNLAGDEALSIQEISQMIGDRLGRAPVFQLASAVRDTDLVADVSLLRKSVQLSLTSFADGLGQTLSSILTA